MGRTYSTAFLSSTSSRLNILFWCQSLGIIEQSAPFDSLHFAQTFNCHTGRMKSTNKRRNTQQSIHRRFPQGTRLQYIQQTSRVISKRIRFSLFSDEENTLSCCHYHCCACYCSLPEHKTAKPNPTSSHLFSWGCEKRG